MTKGEIEKLIDEDTIYKKIEGLRKAFHIQKNALEELNNTIRGMAKMKFIYREDDNLAKQIAEKYSFMKPGEHLPLNKEEWEKMKTAKISPDFIIFL